MSTCSSSWPLSAFVLPQKSSAFTCSSSQILRIEYKLTFPDKLDQHIVNTLTFFDEVCQLFVRSQLYREAPSEFRVYSERGDKLRASNVEKGHFKIRVAFQGLSVFFARSQQFLISILEGFYPMDLGFVSQELSIYLTMNQNKTMSLTLSFMHEAGLFTWSEYEIAEQGSDLFLLGHLEASLLTE